MQEMQDRALKCRQDPEGWVRKREGEDAAPRGMMRMRDVEDAAPSTYTVPDGAQFVEGLDVEPGAFISSFIQGHPHCILL